MKSKKTAPIKKWFSIIFNWENHNSAFFNQKVIFGLKNFNNIFRKITNKIFNLVHRAFEKRLYNCIPPVKRCIVLPKYKILNIVKKDLMFK